MQVGGQDGAPAVVSGQPQVTEGDCRGQQGRDPKRPVTAPTAWRRRHIPSLPRRSRPGGTVSLHLPAPPAGLP